MRERRICTHCHGDRCVVVASPVAGPSVHICPTCNGDGVELLELAEPLRPRSRQLVIWYQLDLDLPQHARQYSDHRERSPDAPPADPSSTAPDAPPAPDPSPGRTASRPPSKACPTPRRGRSRTGHA